MKRNILLRRPLVTAGISVASLVLVSTLILAGLNMRHVHASGTGGGGGGGYYGCTPLNGAPTCHFSGASVNAGYATSTDCIYSSAGMMVFDNVVSDQPGAPIGGPTMYVWVSSYDMCNYVDLENASGYTTAFDFKHDAALDSASVTATLQLTNPYVSAPPINVAINLTWKGVGSETSYLDSYQVRSGSMIYMTHFKADSRSAVVSGTFSDGTTNYAATPTMTTLYNAVGGTLTIVRQ